MLANTVAGGGRRVNAEELLALLSWHPLGIRRFKKMHQHLKNLQLEVVFYFPQKRYFPSPSLDDINQGYFNTVFYNFHLDIFSYWILPTWNF